jgi:hypothetical protein
MSTPEVPHVEIKRENRDLMSRIIFEQGPGKAIFAAELYKTDGLLNCYWPCGKSLDIFKKTVEGMEGNVQWEERNGSLWGVSGERTYWFDPMYEGRAPRAGFQAETAKCSTVEADAISQNAVSIASQTMSELAKIPLNLKEELNNFINASLKSS